MAGAGAGAWLGRGGCPRRRPRGRMVGVAVVRAAQADMGVSLC